MILTLSPHIKKDSWQENQGCGSTAEMTTITLPQDAAAFQDEQRQDLDGDAVYYFAYGVMVHPMARHARGVTTESATAALLPNHRLNFSVGGAANIEAKTGWEVYGVVMKCSPQTWEKIEEFESGYECIEVDVFTIKSKDELEQEGDCTIEEEGFARVHETPIKARTFVVPDDKKKTIPTRIPQERSLRVIASGLELYNVDQDYINDEIMGVEFIPRREPQDYYTFPSDHKELPKLTLAAWEKEYWKRMKKADKKKKSIVMFRLGEHVMEVQDIDPEHPFCVFLKKRLAGPQDSTWRIMQTLFDPDMPIIKSETLITSKQHEWAEDQMAEKFQLSDFVAKRIYQVELPDTKEEGNTNGSISLTKDAMRNLQANIAQLSLLEQLEHQTASTSSTSSSKRRRGRKSTSILKSTFGWKSSSSSSSNTIPKRHSHHSASSFLHLLNDDSHTSSAARSRTNQSKKNSVFRRSRTETITTRSVCTN